jgi:hypothetical protein
MLDADVNCLAENCGAAVTSPVAIVPSPSIPVRTTLINDMYDAHSDQADSLERNHYNQAVYNGRLLPWQMHFIIENESSHRWNPFKHISIQDIMLNHFRPI